MFIFIRALCTFRAKQKEIKALQHILLYLATAIIMAHSVLPHHHQEVPVDAKSTDINKQEDNFLGFLKLMFYQDIGEGHLEHFDMNNDQILADQLATFSNPAPHVFCVWSARSLPTPTNNAPLIIDDPLPEKQFVFIPSLRGPPSYS